MLPCCPCCALLTGLGSPQQIVRRKKRTSVDQDKGGAGGKWLAEEDARLRAGVEALGAKNWKRISEE